MLRLLPRGFESWPVLARLTVLLLVLVISPLARADDEASPHRLSVSLGLGIASPSDERASDANAGGFGGYGSVEYVYRSVEWATPRAYAGVLIAPTSEDCELTPCEVSASIVFTGIKGRLLAPIPYVAPFFELGIGASFGSVTTRAGDFVDVESDGAMYHIPVALGLALGKDHRFEIALQYLFHPEQEQFNGAFALGLEFPL